MAALSLVQTRAPHGCFSRCFQVAAQAPTAAGADECAADAAGELSFGPLTRPQRQSARFRSSRWGGRDAEPRAQVVSCSGCPCNLARDATAIWLPGHASTGLAARARSNILRMHCLPCPAFPTVTLVIMTKSDLLHWRHDMAAACQPLKWRKSLRGPRSEPCATSCRRRAGPAQSGGRRCRPFPRQRRCWLWNAATAATGGPTGLHSRLHLPAA